MDGGYLGAEQGQDDAVERAEGEPALDHADRVLLHDFLGVDTEAVTQDGQREVERQRQRQTVGRGLVDEQVAQLGEVQQHTLLLLRLVVVALTTDIYREREK